MSEWLTINEAGEYLNVTRRTIYTYIQRGTLPAMKIRGVQGGTRIKKEHVENMLVRRDNG